MHVVCHIGNVPLKAAKYHRFVSLLSYLPRAEDARALSKLTTFVDTAVCVGGSCQKMAAEEITARKTRMMHLRVFSNLYPGEK